MTTVRDLIRGSLRLIGAIAQGENPSADEIQDGLYSLNELLDSWSNERMTIYQKHIERIDLAPGFSSITIGPTGTFNTTRPQKIENITYEIQGPTPSEQPIDIVTLDEWAQIQNKSVQSSLVDKVYIQGTFPNETIHMYPIPSVNDKLVIYSWKPIATFVTVNDLVELPPGYLRALRYNLALEIAPEYGLEPSGLVVARAQESKENIKRMNIDAHYLNSDAVAINENGSFNWVTGV